MSGYTNANRTLTVVLSYTTRFVPRSDAVNYFLRLVNMKCTCALSIIIIIIPYNTHMTSF